MPRSLLALCFVVVACGGTTSGPVSDGTGGGTSSTGGTGSASGGSSGTGGRVPLVHRSTPTACQAPPPTEPPPSQEPPDPSQLCASDAECVGGSNGRCVQQRGGMFCVYDQCYSDSQCADGAVCECRQGYQGNACLPSGCRVDGDCPGSWCSPTMGTCGAYSGIIGYQCHTPQDECTDDVDCASPNMGPGYCMYGPQVGHWICGYGQCVG